MTFEEALARLDAIIEKLNDGQTPLADSLALYAEGVELLRSCSGRLADARVQIETLLPKKETKA